MIEGNTVIEEAAETSFYGWLIALLVCIGTALSFGFVFFLVFKTNVASTPWMCPILVVFSILLCAAFIGTLFACEATGFGVYETGETIYTVTLDDTVSYNKFIDTYDIISEDDGIYRIMIKDGK